ncbi:unnamed protein product, partial [Rotaria magnacalcarata]
RCIDRKLETMTILDSDSLELFIHDHIVPLWEKPGWMTAKKIISEVIRIEYRPLRDTNPIVIQTSQAARVTPAPPVAERIRKDSQTMSTPPQPPPPSTKPSHANQPPKVSNPSLPPATASAKLSNPNVATQQSQSKISNTNTSSTVNATKVVSQPQNLKTTENKPSIQPVTNQAHGKSLEMATRVTTNPTKQHASHSLSSESIPI